LSDDTFNSSSRTSVRERLNTVHLRRLSEFITDHLLPSAAVFYLVGATFGYWYNLNGVVPGYYWLYLPFPLLVVGYIAFPGPFRPFICLALFSSLGITLTLLDLSPPQQKNHIAHIIRQRQQVSVVGTVASLVSFNGEKSRFLLDTEEVLIHGVSDQNTGFLQTHGRIRLSLRADVSKTLWPGMQILAAVRLAPVRNYQTPGSFDYKGYLAQQGVYLTGWIDAEQKLLILTHPHKQQHKVHLSPEYQRQQIIHFLDLHLERDVAGLYQALLVGYRGNIPPETLEAYKKAGVFHLLAISGLHLGLLGTMCIFALIFIGKRSQWLLLHIHVPTLAALCTAPLLLGYCFIAGANPPVVRALLMAGIGIYALLVRRQKNLLHIIAAAALIMLVFSPTALFTASFQLSYAAVLSIALLLPLFTGPALQEPSEQKSSVLQYAVIKLGLGFFLVSCVATVGTLPIMLHHFNRFSLAGPLTNVLVEPLLCFWALPFGLIALPLIHIAPDLAILLLATGKVGITLTASIVTFAAKLPFADFWGVVPTWYETALIYLGLLLLSLSSLFGKKRGTAFFLCCFAIAGLSYTSSLWAPAARKETTIDFLDVGQGNATMLRLIDGRNILIDGGGPYSSHFDVGRSVIAPFLRRKRIWHLDSIVVSHPDSDHYNGIPFILKQFHPETLYVNGQTKDNSSYQNMLRQATGSGIVIKEAAAEDIFSESQAYSLKCLGMPGLLKKNYPYSSNAVSLVALLNQGPFSILLPGDIPKESELILLQHYPNLSVNILEAAHHGSISSSGTSFVQGISPEVILVSAGASHWGKHPHTTLLNHWKKLRIPVFSTAIHGTISCVIDEKHLHLSTFSTPTKITLPEQPQQD